MALNPTDVAIALARQTGSKFEDEDIDRKQSDYYYGKEFILMHKNGTKIARFDQRVIRARCSGAIVDADPQLTKTEEAQAIAWARSMGYPVPVKPDGCLMVLLIALGLIIFVLPGLALIIYVVWKTNQYQKEIEALVVRWVNAGKPEPGVRENLEAKQAMTQMPMPPKPKGLEEKLDDLVSMKAKGLVSEEEFEVLRKRALGLDT